MLCYIVFCALKQNNLRTSSPCHMSLSELLSNKSAYHSPWRSNPLRGETTSRQASGGVATFWTFLRRLTRLTNRAVSPAWFLSTNDTLSHTTVCCVLWFTRVRFRACCRGKCSTQTPATMIPFPVCDNLKLQTQQSLPSALWGRSLKYHSTGLDQCTFYIWGYYRHETL